MSRDGLPKKGVSKAIIYAIIFAENGQYNYKSKHKKGYSKQVGLKGENRRRAVLKDRSGR
jgi:hypothetical protein